MGGSFTHFSNGALKKPNYGINIAGPRLNWDMISLTD